MLARAKLALPNSAERRAEFRPPFLDTITR